MKKPALLLLSLLVTLQIPTVNAVEVSARNAKLHLSDTITNQDSATIYGLKETLHAPEGQKFLSVAMDLVARGWEKDGPRDVGTNKDSIFLKIGDQNLPLVGELRMPNSYYLTGQDVRISRPNSGDENYTYAGPTFLVPAGFKTGVLTIGDLLTMEINASVAKPIGSSIEGIKIAVTESSLENELLGRWSMNSDNGDLTIQPMKGKLLVTTIEISAADITQKTYATVSSREFSIACEGINGGAPAPCGGTMRRARARDSKEIILLADAGGNTSTSVAPENTGKMIIFFTVPNGQSKFTLHYHGDPVTTFQVD
ncbi:MAG: hypothetical protein ACSHX9_14380 [Luteolibacter sp.]